jgi:ribosomal protein S25
MAHTIRKRKTVPLPSGTVNVWALLEDAMQGAVERPENSVTPAELAARIRVTHSRASAILRDSKDLRSVRYRMESGKKGVCYVPAKQGNVSR